MSHTIICADALEWLTKQNNIGGVVTSLPDADEVGLSLAEWRIWFVQAATLVMKKVDLSAPAVFYQTDRKMDGEWVSKSYLLIKASEHAKTRLLWHKIVLRREVGGVDLFRPGYTHLMAFSHEAGPGTATFDVMTAGRMIYKNAMGLDAAIFACRFVSRYTRTITDPFCGRGTVPAVADALGLVAVGVDIDAEQCNYARTLKLKPPTKHG